MSTLTFARDLSRTTLAPPMLVAEFGAAPDFRFLTRRVALHRAGDGFELRIGDTLGRGAIDDHASAAFAHEIDGRRAFREAVTALEASRAWRKRRAP